MSNERPTAEKGLLVEADREALSDWQAPGGRLEATVEQIVASHVARVVSGVRAWCAINEIAEPPLDWEGLGEFLTRVLPTGSAS